jgi:hypothetical protein
MIKVFINDSREDKRSKTKMRDLYEKTFRRSARRLEMDINILSQGEEDITEFPSGYNIYLIHYSDLADLVGPMLLRQTQPQSEIAWVARGGGVQDELLALGGSYGIITQDITTAMLERARNFASVMGGTKK